MKSGRRPGRRAYLLIETVAAAILVAGILTATLSLLGWLAVERRSAERRGWALQEASNALERVAAQPFAEIEEDRARSLIALSDGAREVLPEARLQVRVVPVGDGLKRVSVELRWKGRAGRDEPPVRLTCWAGEAEASR